LVGRRSLIVPSPHAPAPARDSTQSASNTRGEARSLDARASSSPSPSMQRRALATRALPDPPILFRTISFVACAGRAGGEEPGGSRDTAGNTCSIPAPFQPRRARSGSRRRQHGEGRPPSPSPLADFCIGGQGHVCTRLGLYHCRPSASDRCNTRDPPARREACRCDAIDNTVRAGTDAGPNCVCTTGIPDDTDAATLQRVVTQAEHMDGSDEGRRPRFCFKL